MAAGEDGVLTGGRIYGRLTYTRKVTGRKSTTQMLKKSFHCNIDEIAIEMIINVWEAQKSGLVANSTSFLLGVLQGWKWLFPDCSHSLYVTLFPGFPPVFEWKAQSFCPLVKH